MDKPGTHGRDTSAFKEELRKRGSIASSGVRRDHGEEHTRGAKDGPPRNTHTAEWPASTEQRVARNGRPEPATHDDRNPAKAGSGRLSRPILRPNK